MCINVLSACVNAHKAWLPPAIGDKGWGEWGGHLSLVHITTGQTRWGWLSHPLALEDGSPVPSVTKVQQQMSYSVVLQVAALLSGWCCLKDPVMPTLHFKCSILGMWMILTWGILSFGCTVVLISLSRPFLCGWLDSLEKNVDIFCLEWCAVLHLAHITVTQTSLMLSTSSKGVMMPLIHCP